MIGIFSILENNVSKIDVEVRTDEGIEHIYEVSDWNYSDISNAMASVNYETYLPSPRCRKKGCSQVSMFMFFQLDLNILR